MFNFPQMISIRYGQTVGSLNISSTVQQHPKIRTTKESQVIVEEHGLWGGWLWCRFIVLSQSDQRPSGSKRIISLCLVRFTSFSRVLPFKKIRSHFRGAWDLNMKQDHANKCSLRMCVLISAVMPGILHSHGLGHLLACPVGPCGYVDV